MLCRFDWLVESGLRPSASKNPAGLLQDASKDQAGLMQNASKNHILQQGYSMGC